MEARKIIVISSNTQNQTVLMSSATTLGELKRELDAKHVDYRGMTFLEGHTKTEMNLDDAILPTNIPYRGTTTNDLVFLLTTPQKKIRSGADRISIYGIIRDKHLEDNIKEKFGKNFTNVSTDDLDEFVNSLLEEDGEVKNYFDSAELVCKMSKLCKSVLDVLDVLAKAGFIHKPEEKKGELSNDEILDLFGDMLGVTPEEEDDDDEDNEDEE